MIKKIINKILYLDGNRRYNKYFESIFPSEETLNEIRHETLSFETSPKISIIVPTYNTPITFLREMIESVSAQTYENWELLLVDDCSTKENVREIIEKYARTDRRIKFKFLKQNLHIAGATNEAFKMVTGDFVALFDHDDLLWPNALFEVTKAINGDKNIDFIYTDEDKIVSETAKHKDAFLKPDWNESLLFCVNYITHLTVIKKTLLDETGGEKTEYNGAQDWDLILRATHLAKEVHHIPKILYSWRVHSESTAGGFGAKPYVLKAQEKALKDNLNTRGIGSDEANIRADNKFPGQWTNDVWDGKITNVFDLNKIKGLALDQKDVHKFFGYNSLTEHIYKTCRYELNADNDKILFVPKK